MPINVFGNSSNNSEQKIDTSLFVKKPYLRTNYIESNIEEDIDLKIQFRTKNLPDPISIREPASKKYVDNLFNNPSILKNNAHIDLKDKNITNCRFLSVNQLPQIDSHLTAKLYVDNAISNSVNESSLVRNNKDNDFGNYNLTNINCINLNKLPENDNEVVTKTYVDQFHNDNERNRRDVGLSFYNEEVNLLKNKQDNDLNDNKLTNLYSITINRKPILDNEVSNKKFIDNELNKNTILRFNQTLQDYLKVSIGDTIYNLTKYKKISIADVTEIKFPNIGFDLLQKWNIYCNNYFNQSRENDFIKSTKSNSPTPESGPTTIPPLGISFKYIETSSANHGDNVFVSFERTDIIQISNITFYYSRYSILTDDNKKSMGRFRIQLLLDDNSWSTVYTIDKNTQYSDNSTDWTLLNLDFTQENYGIKLIYDEIDGAHADMGFSNITITHSVY